MLLTATPATPATPAKLATISVMAEVVRWAACGQRAPTIRTRAKALITLAPATALTPS
jgi:hypothetical protein